MGECLFGYNNISDVVFTHYFEVISIGDAKVGKSSIMSQLADGVFNEE